MNLSVYLLNCTLLKLDNLCLTMTFVTVVWLSAAVSLAVILKN